MAMTRSRKQRRGKPDGELKAVALRVLVTEDEQLRIQAAAAKEERTVSAWVRLLALERAELAEKSHK